MNNTNNIAEKNYSHCYGCGLCTLVCPVWHQSHDVYCTPHAHAKAMQSGGEVNLTGLFDCILCGACEQVCPENIPLIQMMIKLRQDSIGDKSFMFKEKSLSNGSIEEKTYPVLFLADDVLLEYKTQSKKDLFKQTLELLNSANIGKIAQAQDNGSDIIQALKMGVEISTRRLNEFLSTFESAKKVIVSNGLLKTALQQWLPKVKIVSLGYVLSNLSSIQQALGDKDLYVIEALAYNSNFESMVTHYHQFKQHSGCQLNLDLQRLAVPTGSIDINQHRPESVSETAFEPYKQSQWILQGLNIDRIVVESIEDAIVLAQVSDKPVIHLSELLSS